MIELVTNMDNIERKSSTANGWWVAFLCDAPNESVETTVARPFQTTMIWEGNSHIAFYLQQQQLEPTEPQC